MMKIFSKYLKVEGGCFQRRDRDGSVVSTSLALVPEVSSKVDKTRLVARTGTTVFPHGRKLSSPGLPADPAGSPSKQYEPGAPMLK